jgi:hypothetical protein
MATRISFNSSRRAVVVTDAVSEVVAKLEEAEGAFFVVTLTSGGDAAYQVREVDSLHEAPEGTTE